MHTMTVPAAPVLDTDFTPPPVGWRKRGVAVLAVAVLFLVAAQGWMPQVLSRHAPEGGAAATRPEPARAVDADTVAERARYAIEPVPGRTGDLQVVGDSYRAGFDRAGFTYTPTRGAEPLALSLSDLARGDRAIPLERQAWTGDANVARRPVADGVSEQVTARTGEVEWDLVLAERPAGRGDLFVGADLAGVVGAPTRTGKGGWELRLTDGQTVEMGEIVVIDARNRVLHRGRPTIDDGRVGLRVPDAALQEAAYPLTVDPTVGGRIPLASGLTAPDHSGVAFNGTDFLVVWHEYNIARGVYVVRGRRVSGNGQTLFAGFEVSPNTAYFAWYPEVVWTGSNFLVVWERRYSDTDLDVHGQFVSSADGLVGNRLLISNGSGSQSQPTVTSAGDGSGYVAWQDNRNGNGFDIFGAPVDANGNLPIPGGRAVAVSTPAETTPDVAFNGDVYLVTFERADDVQAQRVFRSGVPTGGRISVSVSSTVREEVPAVASDRSQFLVAWQDSRGGGDVRAARVDGAGAVLDSAGIAVATSSATQGYPVVAFSGVYLVAWTETVPGGGGVRATRVARTGSVSDPGGFTVRAPNSEASPFSPAASAGAGNEKWGVSYAMGGSIEANLVSSK
jgi:hypothetical protein